MTWDFPAVPGHAETRLVRNVVGTANIGQFQEPEFVARQHLAVAGAHLQIVLDAVLAGRHDTHHAGGKAGIVRAG